MHIEVLALNLQHKKVQSFTNVRKKEEEEEIQSFKVTKVTEAV